MPKIIFRNGDGSDGEIVVQVETGSSLLDAAEDIHAHMGSSCGGNLACSTCHCWIEAGIDSLSDPEEGEEDILDKAFDVKEESRLGCQAIVADDDLVVVLTPESLQAWLDEHPAERGH